ncbi:MAG: serine/threonine protein kinase [Chloroflexi bacterium]|nr:serine/threonine protein kinase [Chloroflexota bacterium]
MIGVSYALYGLNLLVNRPIPGLALRQVDIAPGVVVHWGEHPGWLGEVPAGTATLTYTSPLPNGWGKPVLQMWQIAGGAGSTYHLRFLPGHDFWVKRDGTELWADWPPQADPALVIVQLLGPVMGFLQRLRGVLALHAGAVAVQGRAVAIAGQRGAGKSTLTVALAQMGCPVISDDVAALAEADGRFLLQPGYAGLRLWPDAAAGLTQEQGAMPPLFAGTEKLYCDLERYGLSFQSHPLSLAAIYLLDGESEPGAGGPVISELSRRDSLLALLSHTRERELLDRQMRIKEFDQLARLTQGVPVRRLCRPAGLAAVPAAAEALLADAARL